MTFTMGKFYSTNGKRQILIVDDDEINRGILAELLQNEYELLFAENGVGALEVMRENKSTLSLVLLDLLMPELSGTDVLRILKSDSQIGKIPVIVMTADDRAETECLTLGAVDFISKPYPPEEVVRARIKRTIELYEDRQIISSTERDPLTGLFNRDYFYSYCERYDKYHPDIETDAIVVDVNHFHIINDRFGMAHGDRLLSNIAEKLRETIRQIDGIVCRRSADTFLIYCPHTVEYKMILENASVGIDEEDLAYNHIRLRMGVYVKCDKSLDIVRRFDRAKMAADTIRRSYTKNIEFYDETLRERELYAERLVVDFQRAINEKEFKVYYQPKYNIRPATPVLSSAEALVRWNHHEFGMISPATFIPLFEENGLIQELDRFVWRTAAAQVREWKRFLGFTLPVSVNVSRIDLYDPDLLKILKEIIDSNGLSPEDLLLEITESAYTDDSEQIIEVIKTLRGEGFSIEMDDFGTGYSSLNMISMLPIDALKLDMKFIRTAFKEKRDTRMIEVIVDIASYLAVPIIAEGVETEEQVTTLRNIGCDIIQGYYFSKPVPPDEFMPFISELAKRSDTAKEHVLAPTEREKQRRGVAFSSIAQALSQDYFSIYYVDTETDWFVEYSSYGDYQRLGIEKSGDEFFEMSRKNSQKVLHPEDRERFLKVFTKENVMRELEEHRTFTMSYRLMLDGVPTYVHLKATAMADKRDRHIVIGVSSYDAEMKRLHAMAEKNNK